MKMKYSVIIAERNEPDLKNTVANITHNSNANVIVQSDREGQGPQLMRHRGIMEATDADVVIIMDGHMRVKPGTLDALAAWCMDNSTSVAVPQCFHSYEQDWTGKPYGGARFAWTDYGHDKREPQAFAGKWRKESTVGQIPCVMGACYAFKRDWYIDGIRAPWAFGTGWGCDEEILSAATWLRGGTVDLLPLQVWHQARKPGQVPYKMTRRQLFGVWANRTRIIDMMPMTLNDKTELIRHIIPAMSANEWRTVNKINAIFTDEVEAYRQFLANGPMKWAEFKEMMSMETVKPMGMKAMRAIAKEKGITVPFGCKKGELLSMLQGSNELEQTPKTVEVEKKPAPVRANWGAGETNNAGKRCCVHCDSCSTTVTRTMQAMRLVQRYRLCNDCNKRFPTREILATL
jgi:hypothetical protein